MLNLLGGQNPNFIESHCRRGMDVVDDVLLLYGVDIVGGITVACHFSCKLVAAVTAAEGVTTIVRALQVCSVDRRQSESIFLLFLLIFIFVAKLFLYFVYCGVGETLTVSG